MATQLIMGIKHIRDGLEAQTVLGADMSTIGIVGIAPDADTELVPADQPIEVRTNDQTMLQALGATGTIPDALTAISAQLANVGAARCVIVRVAEGEDADETIDNIVGSEASGTGIWALLDAPEELAVTPRLIIVPGYTSQSLSGITGITVTNGGSGYTSAPTVSFSGGGGTGLAATAVVSGGVVTAVNITNAGSGYTSAPTVSFSGGEGSNAAATAVHGIFANKVCAALPTVLDRLRGVFIPEGPTNTRQAALNWMETLTQTERFLHPLRQDAQIQVSGSLVTKPLSPYIVGLYVRRDAEFDGVPGRSAANQPVAGLVGVTPAIPLSLTDASSLGQTDLENQFGIVVRGELGVEDSISDGGFVFWGTDTLSESSDWLFANVSRMRDYIELGQVKALKYYLGRFNITVQTVQAVVNTMESQLAKLKHDQHILDFRIEFEPDANTPEELRLGHLDIIFKAEEPPVLRKIILRSRKHREALTDLVRQIAIQVGTAL